MSVNELLIGAGGRVFAHWKKEKAGMIRSVRLLQAA
jgi:hypothetical protein